MKIGVAGAGAVGCVFGGALSKAGHPVTFLARGAQLDAMKQRGLQINGENETYIVDGQFTEDPSDLAQSDLVLFSVKSNDTKSMAEFLNKELQTQSLVLTLQNGVDNEEVLKKVLGSERILSAATYVQAFVCSPGNVKQQGRIKLVLGELEKGAKSKCLQIIEVFNQAGIHTEYSPNIMEEKWNKLLWNVTFNPLSAIASVRIGEILDNEYLQNIAKDICLEAIQVAKRMNVPIENNKMAQIFRNAEFARGHQTSMLQDRIEGKRMEIESVCGYLLEKGMELRLPMPTLKTVYRLLKHIDQK